MQPFVYTDRIEILGLRDEANRPRAFDPRFNDLIFPSAAVHRLMSGTAWGEGPVWFGDGRYLLWSDIPNDRILRWCEITQSVSVFRQPAHFPNGNTRDRQGRLLTCEHETRRVTRTEYDGSITVLADRHEDRRLNSPNDIVTHPLDGAVWFTDPDYGLKSAFEGGGVATAELPTGLYRVDPDGTVGLMAEDFENPNGLCFSPDGAVLYVIETGPVSNRLTACRLDRDHRHIVQRRLLIENEPGALMDGMRTDSAGNLWCGWGNGPGLDGVRVFAPDGCVLGHIPLPERCANLCFGGEGGGTLFMTATHGLYRLRVNARGAP